MKLSAYLADIYQLGYVTRDMDVAVEYLSRELGIPEFFRRESERTVKLRGEDTPFKILVALANVGERQIEIIQPLEGVVDFYHQGLDLDRAPVALHHFGIIVDDPDKAWEPMRRDWLDSGRELALEGGDPAFVRFAYADTRKDLGHYLEFLGYSAEGRRWNENLPNAVK